MNTIKMNKLKIMTAVLLFTILPSLLSALEIHKVDRNVMLGTDHYAQISLNINFTTNSSDDLLNLPMTYSDIELISATLNGKNVRSDIEIKTGVINSLQLQLNEKEGKQELLLVYMANNAINWEEAGPGEFASYEYSTEIENPFITTIDTFKLAVILPDGWSYHKILSSYPEFKKKDPQPPYKLNYTEEGKSCLCVTRTPMEYRDKVGFEFVFKEKSKTKLLIFIGILLAIAYMYFFRELITKHKQTK